MAEDQQPGDGNRRRQVWIGVGTGTVMLLIVSCLSCIGLFAFLGSKAPEIVEGISQQTRALAEPIDRYSKAMDDKRPDDALGELTEAYRRIVTFTTLRYQLDGPDYSLFEGYDSLSIEQFQVNATPLGPFGYVRGRTNYGGGFEGTFVAQLRQGGGQWKIDQLNLTVPPAKTADYLNRRR